MKNLKHLLFLAAAILLAVSCGNHKLFNNGGSDYTIIISQDATPSEKYAANELKHWIKEVSGADLPVAGLDGGKIFFILLKIISGGRINDDMEYKATVIGMIVLLTLFALITLNDVMNLFG